MNINNGIQSTKIFEMADAFQSSSILFFANKEKLFDVLETPMSAEEVSNKKGWLPWKTRILLDSLVALDLLTKKNAQYQNTEATSKFLVQTKPSYQGDIVEHERLQWTLSEFVGQNNDNRKCDRRTARH